MARPLPDAPPECEMKHFSTRVLAAAVALSLTSCIDGDGGTGVPTPRTITLSGEAIFAVGPVDETLAAVDRATLVLYDDEADTILVSIEDDFDPAADLEFSTTFQLLQGQALDVRLEAALLDDDMPVGEDVVFSGQQEGQIPPTGGSASIRVVLGRGPSANLLLTSLEITSDDELNVQEGATRFIEFDTVGAAPGQRIFFESTEPEVAVVDNGGRVLALTPGVALVVASGGRVADTLSLTVGEVSLPDEAELRRMLLPQFDYVTSDLFLNTLSDEPARPGLRGAYQALINEMLAGRGFESVGRFESAQALWEGYGIDSGVRDVDGPQVGVLALTLIYAADVLGIDFLR